MRYSLIDLASVDRQTMPYPSFDLVFNTSLRGMTHNVPDAIMVAIAIIITRAYHSATEHVITYGRHEFVCPALDYNQYLALKDAWQWLSKDDYTMFNKVHSADFAKQEYFFRLKKERCSAKFDGREVYLIAPARMTKPMRGEILVRETRNCTTLLDGKESLRMNLPQSGIAIDLRTPQLKEA